MKIGGVTVGQVASIDLDPVKFESIVTLRMDSKVKDLPADTSAGIFTSGLLGESYIGLQPGGDPDVLKAGDDRLHPAGGGPDPAGRQVHVQWRRRRWRCPEAQRWRSGACNGTATMKMKLIPALLASALLMATPFLAQAQAAAPPLPQRRARPARW